MKLFSLALAALAAAQTYDTGGAVWREIRDFVDDFTEWASRNLVAVLIVAVGIAFLWGLVFAKPRRR